MCSSLHVAINVCINCRHVTYTDYRIEALTVVSKVEVDKVQNDIHEVFYTDRPRTVHISAVWARESRRSDLSSSTS